MESQSKPQGQETLQFEQVIKLNNAYQMPVEVHGKGNFPTLEIRMQDLVHKVCEKMKENGIVLGDVRVNGGVATYIVGDCETNPLSYNDVDLIFSVSLQTEEQSLRIKDYVMECLLTYLPEATNREKLTNAALTDAYVSKLTKVWQPKGDKWTLVTLSNKFNMNLELKFVDTMKRKYQFSVDSFQIILDSLKQFYELSSSTMTEDFYPTVIVESVYGDYREAVDHLNNRLISTRTPQDIRGGGLLKYCDLLARGYVPASSISETETLERLMCSRFFIDYSEIAAQYQKLDSYLINHFGKNYSLMLRYLNKLHEVVNNSTVCLMGHERRQALDLISQMAYHVQYELEMQHRHSQSNLIFSTSWAEDKYALVYDDYFHQNYYAMQQQPQLPSMYGYYGIQYAY